MAKYILGKQSQNRNTIIRYTAVIGFYLFLLAIVQTSVLAVKKPFGGVPDLLLSTVLCISLYCGCYAGAVTGIAAGFLTDAIGTVGLSILPLVYFLVAYFFGYYTKVLGVRGYLTYLIGVGISLPVRLIATLIQSVVATDGLRGGVFMTATALPELLGTLLFSLILYFPAKWISQWLKKRG